MKTIAASILALGAALASPALANEAVHNGARVTTATVEPSITADNTVLAGTLSTAFFADRVAAIDPARAALSGK